MKCGSRDVRNAVSGGCGGENHPSWSVSTSSSGVRIAQGLGVKRHAQGHNVVATRLLGSTAPAINSILVPPLPCPTH